MSYYNRFLEKGLLPLGDWLLGNTFMEQLILLRKQVLQKEEELKELQKQKLLQVLQHATANAPYYKSLGIPPHENSIEWLKKFPVLDKKILRQQQDNLLTYPKQNLIIQHSSGSSGVQSMVYWSKLEQDIHRATQIHWWEWAGYSMGSTLIQTGLGTQRSWVKKIKDILFNTKYLFAFSLENTIVSQVLKKHEKDKNAFLGGYASSLYDIARIAKEENLKVQFKAVISWGDKLFSHYRKAIEEGFGTKVFETYGTTEGMMIAAQKDLEYMYIMTPDVYLEILDEEGNEVPDGQIGNVVVTNLNGFAMPLIRYKIGDLAAKLPLKEYPEKRQLHLPLLRQVIGRDTDLVKTRYGRTMIVHSFTGIFEYYPEIEQFCVLQENLDGIIIQYIAGNNFHVALLDQIKTKILHYLKEDFKITFQQVEFIKPTASGKPQIIISKLPK